MDFEWEKLINGESEIDADDINALADGIIKNKKAIKAIKDIIDNGGTIPEYLTNFFKDRPQGLYVDDLDNLTYENTGGGVFLWGKPQDGAKQNDIVFVTQGFSPRRRDFLVTFQMRISATPLAYAEFDSYNIKQRYQTFSHPTVQEPDGWSEWEDIYTTFKKVPYGKTIDDLYGEEHFGWYVNDIKTEWSGVVNLRQDFDILLVNDGYYRDETIGDLGCYSQTRFVWNGRDFNIQTRYHNFKKWSDWQDVFATPQYVKEQIAKIPTGGGGETWELLQSHEVTEEDGELSELRITFPEGYKEYVVSLERTAPTASSNMIIYPYGKKANGKEESTAFWDYYEGGNASHYELRFSSMELDADNYIKLEGYTYVINQPVKGKPQAMKTSGWINIGMHGNKVSSWHSVTFLTKLNVGSKYKVWGCK